MSPETDLGHNREGKMNTDLIIQCPMNDKTLHKNTNRLFMNHGSLDLCMGPSPYYFALNGVKS